MADFLARARHHFDKEPQVGRGVIAAGLLDQVAAEGNAGHGRLRRNRNPAQFSASASPQTERSCAEFSTNAGPAGIGAQLGAVRHAPPGRQTLWNGGPAQPVAYQSQASPRLAPCWVSSSPLRRL